MNCEEVKANLSLYVAGDIERHGAREMIDAHLAECAPCRALAGEWEASRELLLGLREPPEFDAAFFDSVRRGVMRQISEPRPSPLARLFGRPFGPRTLAYAAVFSLLVCAFILSPHFLRRTRTPPVEVVKEKDGGRRDGGTRSAQGMNPQTPGGGSADVNESAVATAPPRPRPSPRRSLRPTRDDARASAPGEKLLSPPRQPGERQVANAQGVGRVVAPRPGLKAAGAVDPMRVETAEARPDREMLRIELQTADPNIRIIWLSPRTTDSASPNKPNR